MPAKLLAVIAYLLGIGGAGALFVYAMSLGMGHWPRRDSSMDLTQTLATNLALLALFSTQHSCMARTWFKSWWTKIVPESLERSTYVGLAGIVALAMVAFWQPLPGEPLWNGPFWIAGFGLASALVTSVCCLSFDHAWFFGLKQAWTGNVQQSKELQVTGLYRYVRNPQMLGVLMMLWAQPTMPPELLMLIVGLTLYIFVAVRWEESGLVREFGADYEKYRSKVAALIPYVW